MKSTPVRRTFGERWARVAGTSGQAARVVALGLLSLVLAVAGALSLPLFPWAAMALPCGLAIAAVWLWGPLALAGTAAGLAAALLALGLPWAPTLAGALAMATASLLTRLVLRRAGFDARLQRATDVAWLVAATGLAAALPMAGMMSFGQSAGSAAPSAAAILTGWSVLSLGMVACAVAVLAVNHDLLRVLHAGAAVVRPLADLVAVAGMLGLLWIAPYAGPGVATAALVAPHLVVVALALRGRLSLAAAGLLAAALLAAGHAVAGLPLWAPAGSAAAAGAAWLGSALMLMLMAHAATAQRAGREQRWEWALDGSNLGVADWQLRNGDAFASAAWRSLSGHEGSAWSPQAWQACVHEADQAALAEALASLSSGQAGRRQVELRLPRGEGWRWTEATLMVIERDTAGHPLRLLATLADVNQRHEALERQRMSVNLFQNLREGLLITDAEFRVLDLNPAYSQILGVPREELLGTVPSLLRPAPGDPVARQQRAAMWAGLRDAGHWSGELIERRRNGEVCTLAATISTVLGPAQELRYHALVISDISQQRAQLEQIDRHAHFDELTRLPNRVRLAQLLDDAMLAAVRDGYLLVVCYLDLDRFKPVNDRFGRAAGDRLLVELAGRLRGALRSREHWADTAARLGGDEFVLLLRAGTHEEAQLAVERVLRVVSQPYLIDAAQDPVQITASMGATIYPLDHSDADTLLRHADNAMYSAKQAGRNGYLFFDPEHRLRAEQRVMAIGRIQEALDQQEFVLYYQPKADMRTGRVIGFEALLRWEHPQQGMVAPLQFLPLIENTGLSSRIGDWVISQALEHLSHWRLAGLDIAVSVNVSARHLQEPDFAQRLSELLARHAEPLATHLEIEMLETAAHADIAATSALLARCRGTGVRFALDDFGTGYSTLTYLKQLPVDVLKIDRSFVHHMLDDAQDRAIVEGVIGLARTFGCAVVAEGVETPAQARALLEMGCDIGQGTGIAAPMPVAQVAQWARDYRGVFALAPATPPQPGVARLGG